MKCIRHNAIKTSESSIWKAKRSQQIIYDVCDANCWNTNWIPSKICYQSSNSHILPIVTSNLFEIFRNLMKLLRKCLTNCMKMYKKREIIPKWRLRARIYSLVKRIANLFKFILWQLWWDLWDWRTTFLANLMFFEVCLQSSILKYFKIYFKDFQDV